MAMKSKPWKAAQARAAKQTARSILVATLAISQAVNCTTSTVKPRATDKRQEDGPVYHRHKSEQLVIEACSRRLKTAAAVAPCSQLWPALAHGSQAWWSRPAPERVFAVTAEARGDPTADAPRHTTQVNGELQLPTTAAAASMPAERHDLLSRAFDRCFQETESKL